MKTRLVVRVLVQESAGCAPHFGKTVDCSCKGGTIMAQHTTAHIKHDSLATSARGEVVASGATMLDSIAPYIHWVLRMALAVWSLAGVGNGPHLREATWGGIAPHSPLCGGISPRTSHPCRTCLELIAKRSHRTESWRYVYLPCASATGHELRTWPRDNDCPHSLQV